jgi:hypothetical protein
MKSSESDYNFRLSQVNTGSIDVFTSKDSISKTIRLNQTAPSLEENNKNFYSYYSRIKSLLVNKTVRSNISKSNLQKMVLFLEKRKSLVNLQMESRNMNKKFNSDILSLSMSPKCEGNLESSRRTMNSMEKTKAKKVKGAFSMKEDSESLKKSNNSTPRSGKNSNTKSTGSIFNMSKITRAASTLESSLSAHFLTSASPSPAFPYSSFKTLSPNNYSQNRFSDFNLNLNRDQKSVQIEKEKEKENERNKKYSHQNLVSFEPKLELNPFASGSGNDNDQTKDSDSRRTSEQKEEKCEFIAEPQELKKEHSKYSINRSFVSSTQESPLSLSFNSEQKNGMMNLC